MKGCGVAMLNGSGEPMFFCGNSEGLEGASPALQCPHPQSDIFEMLWYLITATLNKWLGHSILVLRQVTVNMSRCSKTAR